MLELISVLSAAWVSASELSGLDSSEELSKSLLEIITVLSGTWVSVSEISGFDSSEEVSKALLEMIWDSIDEDDLGVSSFIEFSSISFTCFGVGDWNRFLRIKNSFLKFKNRSFRFS